MSCQVISGSPAVGATTKVAKMPAVGIDTANALNPLTWSPALWVSTM